MNRPQRRMALVSAGILSVCLGLLGTLGHQHRHLHGQLREHRDQGLRAMERGEHRQAREALEAYLRQGGVDDARAVAGLARAITADANTSPLDRVYAARLLERAADLDQANLGIRLQLVTLQSELGRDRQLIRTADEILALTRRAQWTQETRHKKARALARLGQHAAALEVAAAMVEGLPDGTDALGAHRLMVKIAVAGPCSSREVRAYARRLHEEHGSDVRYKVLLAMAHRLTGRMAEAADILQRCITQPIPDPASVLWLVDELELTDQFDSALAMLQQRAASFESAELDAAVLARLWQRGRVQAVRDYGTGRMSLLAASADNDPLAIMAMALIRLGAHRAAEPWLEILRTRSRTDATAAAWTLYLTNVFDQPVASDVSVRRCLTALHRDSANGYIRFELASALARQGDRWAAVAHWRKAAAAHRAWPEPRLRAAEMLIDLGMAGQAVRMAEGASQRVDADDLTARIVLAEARHLRLDLEDGADHPAALLERVRSIQRQWPHEPRTLAIYVDLLTRLGQREHAGDVLLAALHQPLPEATLLALARVSRAHGLGLAEAYYAQCEALYGRTPALAYARALDAWKRGRIERALADLTTPEHIAADTSAARDWHVARARFYDRTEAARATQAWRTLIERHGEELVVVRAALESEAVWQDRHLARKVIAQLRALTDETGTTWRLAQARWLLEADHPTPTSAAKAALLLAPMRREMPELVEPRLWLARAFVELNEPAAAIAQLRAASEHVPHHQPTLLALAQLLLEQGDGSVAQAILFRVVDNATSTAQELQSAAAMLVRLREWDAAMRALRRAAAADSRAPGDLLTVGRTSPIPMNIGDNR